MKITARILTTLTLSFSTLGLIPQNAEASAIYYDVIDLGFQATDINNHGQISGNIGNSGVFWDESSGIQYIDNVGPYSTRAYALNDQGQVVGSTSGGAFVWDAVNGIQSLGNVSAFGTSSTSSVARDINNQGEIVGTYSLTVGSITSHSNSFLWTSSGGMRDLTHGSEDLEILNAGNINDAGVVLAESLNQGSFGDHPVTWDEVNGKENIGFYLYESRAITDSGLVVGAKYERSYSNSYGSGIIDHAALLDIDTNEIISLGRLGGRQSIAIDANEIGQVIGTSETAQRLGGNHFQKTAFIWDSQNGMQDLNALVDPAFGQSLTSLTAINNRGQIIAGQYLLNPTTFSSVSSPATLPLMVLALSGIALFSRKRQ